ncbi:hypothetical protein GLYMA_12G007100v4 [Glycine max]|uniref:Uncharacterized protein n=1 Tax=Glycine max TaxID=3847 RepID=A0A0R0GZS8_SOYBN|nr:hypothetical protein GYH30_032306 [Glycine max]KRH23853.1 hypothetical protein GLYMA_12G007100v4 [Glycine max]
MASKSKSYSLILLLLFLCLLMLSFSTKTIARNIYLAGYAADEMGPRWRVVLIGREQPPCKSKRGIRVIFRNKLGDAPRCHNYL